MLSGKQSEFSTRATQVICSVDSSQSAIYCNDFVLAQTQVLERYFEAQVCLKNRGKTHLAEIFRGASTPRPQSCVDKVTTLQYFIVAFHPLSIEASYFQFVLVQNESLQMLPWYLLITLSVFVLVCCMLLSSLPPVVRVPFLSSRFSTPYTPWFFRHAKQPPGFLRQEYSTQSSTMLKKAIQAHESTSTHQNKSKQQLLLSSSPPLNENSTPLAQKPVHSLQNSFAKSSTLQPAQPSALNTLDNRHSAPNCGVKRTAGGLAKAVGSFGHNSFGDSAQQDASSKSVRVTDKVQKNMMQAENASIFFDEDDFDSDIELEITKPVSKPTVSYPKLPSPKPIKSQPSYAPVQSSNFHNQASNKSQSASLRPDEGPSSSFPFAWSSSPDERLRAPEKPNIKQYTYTDVRDADQAPPKQERTAAGVDSGDPEHRPSKRRTLPWLANEARDLSKEAAEVLEKRSGQDSYPWNTTARAIKDQQKQLRKANKTTDKSNDASDVAPDHIVVSRKPKFFARPSLSGEQRHVLDLVVDSKNSVFFTGSAGTGKSVLLREIISVLRKKYAKETDRIAITASTGLAACNIGGVTLHSFAGIGLGKEDVPELVKKIKRNQKAKHRWMRTKVLIIDEVSMVDGQLFDKLEEIARRIRNQGRPFGGIQLVVTGDFFQLPPVPDPGSRDARFCFDAATWKTAVDHTIGLHHVFRQKDAAFASMLNEMREGRLTPDSNNAFRRLSRPLEYYDDLQATELFPTRSEVETANGQRMRQLAGDSTVYNARDGGSITDKATRDRLLSNCMAPETLELKKGSQVMLIKNIDETLVNGSLGKVIGFMNEVMFDSYHADQEGYMGLAKAKDEDLNPSELKQKRAQNHMAVGTSGQVWPVVRFALADGTTRDMLCNRETWKIELPNGEVQASRAQIPLILAWALSIHKAQGQTLERVKVDLGKVFERGQAYVALSRATSMAGLQVLRFDPQKVMAHPKVRDFYAGLSRAEMAGKSSDDGDGGEEYDYL